MKVFITGGSSYLGRHMISYMVNRGHQVCHTWFSNPPPESTLGTAVQLDVRDEKQVAAVVTAFHPDAIIHLAASNRNSRPATSKSSHSCINNSSCLLLNGILNLLMQKLPLHLCCSTEIFPAICPMRTKCCKSVEQWQSSSLISVLKGIFINLIDTILQK